MSSIANKKRKITRGRKSCGTYYNGVSVMAFTPEEIKRITSELARIVDTMLLLEMIKKENNAR